MLAILGFVFCLVLFLLSFYLLIVRSRWWALLRALLLVTTCFIALIGMSVSILFVDFNTFDDSATIAEITVHRADHQHYQLAFKDEELGVVSYEVFGDMWALDAKLLRAQCLSWLPTLNVFRLERLYGKYERIEDEYHGSRSLYSLSGDVIAPHPWLAWLADKVPCVDYVSGVSVFAPMREGGRYGLKLEGAALIAEPLDAYTREITLDWGEKKGS